MGTPTTPVVLGELKGHIAFAGNRDSEAEAAGTIRLVDRVERVPQPTDPVALDDDVSPVHRGRDPW